MTEEDKKFMRRAIELAQNGMNNGKGGPFGAIVVKEGKIIAEACNNVTSKNDPTAHAEVEVIREACKKLGSFQLNGCILYTSCEPCPMCFGAIYWARPMAVFYACTKNDAARIGFDDQFIYDELDKNRQNQKIKFTKILQAESNEVFKNWEMKTDRKEY